MSSLRPESHVAQQIRRDKLRIQTSSQHLEDFPNNIEQLSLHPGLNSDLLLVRNVRNANMLYESAFFPSEMVNFSTASDPLSAAHRNTMECQDLVAAGPSTSRLMMPQYVSFPHASDPSSSIHSSPTQQCEPRNLGYDWMVNYGNSSVVNESNPNSNFTAQLDNNMSAYQHLVKPSYNELREIQGSLSNPTGETHHAAPPLYQNTLQDIVKSASIMQQTGHGIWMGNGNESDQLLFGNANLWTNRTSDNFHGWNSPLSFSVKKSEEDSGPVLSDSNPQGLSLSLSSSAPPKLCNFQFGEGCGSDELHSKSMKSILKPSLQDLVGIPSNTGYRNVGPLGPFTGYATILKSSRFLKPAQELLDEFCSLSGPNIFKACDVSDRLSREVSASTSAEAINATESGVSTKDSNAGAASSSIFFSPKENNSDGARGSFSFSSPPEYQQKKAKLLYMQEEVIRRYKQYHQQMQMVFSSFETVVGLSSATPYITMALKSVSRHFRCLKNAILDQIKHIREVLGEDFAGSTSGTSSKLNTNMARLRCLDQGLQKNKSGGSDTGVWRHQRGLPERSVAILKAWLFEHFLHPYPTDTDKHMLATQTGLSRNQVSNWFINARVRVWKPMVEEIHMLETRGSTGANQNSGGKNGAEGSSQAVVDQPRNMFGKHANAIPEKQFQCLEMGSEGEQWNQEKRSKLECESTSNMDGTLMGFVPYRRGGVGLGSVSLTLGLRHGVDGVQHQQQQLQQEEQLRRHFGEHMIHDFVG